MLTLLTALQVLDTFHVLRIWKVLAAPWWICTKLANSVKVANILHLNILQNWSYEQYSNLVLQGWFRFLSASMSGFLQNWWYQKTKGWWGHKKATKDHNLLMFGHPHSTPFSLASPSNTGKDIETIWARAHPLAPRRTMPLPKVFSDDGSWLRLPAKIYRRVKRHQVSSKLKNCAWAWDFCENFSAFWCSISNKKL